MCVLKIGNQNVQITHENKILFPKSRITKHDLIKYYVQIADTMIPHIKNRPISMHRFPLGISGESFFQKNVSDYFPEWIKRAPIRRKDTELVNYALCNDVESLVYLANQSCITPHIWLSKIDKLNYPDKMVFDLDPSGKSFSQVPSAAKKVKKLLERLGLTPYVMTTGSRGLHIVVPLIRKNNFDFVRQFAKDVSSVLVKKYPEILTDEIRKAKRGKKIFVDIYRNAFAQTSVAPYAVRAKEGAPVATPIDWREVNNKLTPTKYNIKNIFKKISKRGDAWANFPKDACSLKKARKILDTLLC